LLRCWIEIAGGAEAASCRRDERVVLAIALTGEKLATAVRETAGNLAGL